MIVRFLTYLLIIFISLAAIVRANDTLGLKTEKIVFINFHSNFHGANFSQLPGVPNCCPHFDKGKGIGFSIGGNFQFQLPYRFNVGLGFGYYTWDADFLAYETKPVRIGNNIEQAAIRHTLEISLSDAGLTPYLGYNVIGGLNVFAGAHIGMTIRADFHQYETLTKPDGAFFFDTGTNMRNDTAGKINDVETAYTSLFFGLQYDIRTGDNSKWLISPTITCNWGRSAIVQNYDWRASALMLGVQIKATSPLIKKVEEVYREDTIIDTLTVMSEDVIRNTIVTGKEHIDKYTKALDGKIIHTTVFSRTDTLYRRPVPRISVNINVPLINLEGQFVTQAFPLVPVVFFTKNSADLNTYYYTETNTDTFDIDIIKINALEYQKNLLNIIGKRMRKFLSSKLYIAAYCDSTTEGVNHKLAGKRANTIRQYLENKWTIKPSRLIVKPATGCNPPNATITRNDSGYADNRRAELFSDNPKLLSPVHNKRYIEPKAINPPLLIFDPSGSTSNGIARWALVIKKGEKVISQRSGNGFPGIFYDTLKTKDFTSLFSDIPLTVKFAMIDFEGQIGEVKREIPVKADTSEFELQRLSLILFKVGDETLSKKAKNDIREFLKDISNNSIIRVMGYTDPLGTPKLNKNLSRKRAENTAAFIKKILKGIKVEQSHGYASEAFPPGINSYSTPIERFLSRTVFIEILNKIK